MGDPMRPLKWVSKSPAKLAAVLCQAGHAVCANTVAKLLETRLGYSRQVNRKTHEGTNHPDRDAQFEHISTSVLAAQTARATRHLGRHQEERAGWQLPQRRQRLPAERRSGLRQYA